MLPIMTLRQTLSFGGLSWQYGRTPVVSTAIKPGKTVVGITGADNALFGAGFDTLVGGGGGGDNFFELGRGDRAIAGTGDGIDTITTYFGNVTLPKYFSNGTLGHAGTITGNTGNNILTVTGSGAHTLRAGTGNDVLVGSTSGLAGCRIGVPVFRIFG